MSKAIKLSKNCYLHIHDDGRGAIRKRNGDFRTEDIWLTKKEIKKLKKQVKQLS